MTPIHTKLSIPDIGIFHKYWSKLSEYCHRQINPTDTWDSKDWVKRGYLLLNDVENYLVKISVTENYGWVDKSSLVKDLSDLREEFVNDNIDNWIDTAIKKATHRIENYYKGIQPND